MRYDAWLRLAPWPTVVGGGSPARSGRCACCALHALCARRKPRCERAPRAEGLHLTCPAEARAWGGQGVLFPPWLGRTSPDSAAGGGRREIPGKRAHVPSGASRPHPPPLNGAPDGGRPRLTPSVAFAGRDRRTRLSCGGYGGQVRARAVDAVALIKHLQRFDCEGEPAKLPEARSPALSDCCQRSNRTPARNFDRCPCPNLCPCPSMCPGPSMCPCPSLCLCPDLCPCPNLCPRSADARIPALLPAACCRPPGGACLVGSFPLRHAEAARMQPLSQHAARRRHACQEGIDFPRLYPASAAAAKTICGCPSKAKRAVGGTRPQAQQRQQALRTAA